ncbi:MAG: transposase, partial [Desulfamplus sp.]|nr:transposase [Desulfamplus sp.]
MLSFYPEIQNCPDCNTRLHVQKTTDLKTVTTMDIGAFLAKETVLYCPNGHGTFRSEQLRSLVPKGGTFGFDVIAKVGVALFVHSRSNLEVMAELAARNVFVSEREISFLGRKFIIYLALAHRQSRLDLRELLTSRGGYILHVDGTCEGDSPNLFCGLDGLSELILDAVKVASERKDELVPFFRSIKEQYGEPKALVHDMGKGIVGAVEEVFPDTPDFICHFHFLRDIGKDLLMDEYRSLQKRLRKLKIRPALRRQAKYLEKKIDPEHHDVNGIIQSLQSGNWEATHFDHISTVMTYALIHWIFEYHSQSNGYGFPFDRPHLDFYRRLHEVLRLLGQIMDANISNSRFSNRAFSQLYKVVAKAEEDKRL